MVSQYGMLICQAGLKLTIAAQMHKPSILRHVGMVSYFWLGPEFLAARMPDQGAYYHHPSSRRGEWCASVHELTRTNVPRCVTPDWPVSGYKRLGTFGYELTR